MKTVNGIYNNIDESDYFIIYKDNYKIYFSSQYLMKKFEENVKNYIDEECYKIFNKYNINENSNYISTLEEILLFNFYNKIERRGKRIYKKENNQWLRVVV